MFPNQVHYLTSWQLTFWSAFSCSLARPRSGLLFHAERGPRISCSADNQLSSWQLTGIEQLAAHQLMNSTTTSLSFPTYPLLNVILEFIQRLSLSYNMWISWNIVFPFGSRYKDAIPRSLTTTWPEAIPRTGGQTVGARASLAVLWRLNVWLESIIHRESFKKAREAGRAEEMMWNGLRRIHDLRWVKNKGHYSGQRLEWHPRETLGIWISQEPWQVSQNGFGSL